MKMTGFVFEFLWSSAAGSNTGESSLAWLTMMDFFYIFVFWGPMVHRNTVSKPWNWSMGRSRMYMINILTRNNLNHQFTRAKVSLLAKWSSITTFNRSLFCISIVNIFFCTWSKKSKHILLRHKVQIFIEYQFLILLLFLISWNSGNSKMINKQIHICTFVQVLSKIPIKKEKNISEESTVRVNVRSKDSSLGRWIPNPDSWFF